ncbi:MAG: DUF309 domain-containing protein [Meiothermus sp.]|uniref:DUF309 domain-containing protein n=1 Tax=Meiothermus sp. TaxID=1955249 RepID=UPI00298EEDF4|nr:DUF309 domain-containing protein [Meiothermus sp.]MCX7740378.1 DUF309 domain-containing protein [Meiothermus sp.]MDW8480831.1 DUF309 domain-containing protein [Meiothermus sp.]
MELLETPEYQEAIALWQEGRFWEVHEALEPLWRRLSGPERELTHGVILLAAALHKARTNPQGGWRNYQKAMVRLRGLPSTFAGLHVGRLVEGVRQALQTGLARLPEFPR